MKPDRSKDIAALYHQAHELGLAFAAFRLPGSEKINSISGSVTQSLPDGEQAFAFAPFDPTGKAYYIKNGDELSLKNKSINQKLQSTSKKQFTDLVKKIIAAIRSGDFKKIVAARVLSAKKPSAFDPLALFGNLCERYESAFVSLTYIPGVGLWIGASPEVLVSETKTKLTTYSLAGTKVIGDLTDWSSKEIEEQKIVTDFIQKKLSKTTTDTISLRGPATHQAGGVKHLLSVFTIQHRGRSIWQRVAKALHPTPAVGGMPQHKAVKFVLGQESFDRDFYAGYLGPVNWKGKTDLFVNLRCMQVTDSHLLFYAGCGITADSNPEQEWLESERKIDVIKSLI